MFFSTFAGNMKKLFCIIMLPLVAVCNMMAYDIKSPLYETRAVWLTTIGGIDWPHSYSNTGVSPKVQQREFCDILNKLSMANVNTVILQTRIRATTIFPSEMEPWDGALSGKPGISPGYDALAFAIDECHKRGMKLHAWIVTIPIGKWNGTGCKNLRVKFPDLVKRIGDEGFMNPDVEGTAIYLARFCKDLVSRYDIDGIHLDYIRYPDTWGKITNRNAARANITRIVRQVATAVRNVKPDIEISCSPVGKYADTRRQWSHGWNARDVVCQDAALWMKEGIMDAIYPMMYFKNENFYPFAIDWKERSDGKSVTPGLGIYMMHPKEKNWSLDDITRELWVLRTYGMGNCMFRSKFFTDNTKGIFDFYANVFAPFPAIPRTTKAKDCYHLYGSGSYPVDVNRAENLLAINLSTPEVEHSMTKNIRYFAITRAEDNKVIKEYGDNVNLNEDFNENENLNINQLADGTLVIISTMYGNEYTSAIVKNGKFMTDNLPPGHYKAYIMNKKGQKHLIKRFRISPYTMKK